MPVLRPFLLLCVLAAVAVAQDPFRGNGRGRAFLRQTMLRIGGTVDLSFGSPLAPSGLSVVGLSDGLGPTQHPLAGLVGLDLLSGALELRFFPLDTTGTANWSVPIPATPALALQPPIFGAVAVCEPNGVSVSRTVRLLFENADSYSPAGSLLTARAGHTAVLLARSDTDNEQRVFVAGGGGGTILMPQASTSTELYSPVLRSSVAGPPLLQPRALHQAVRLQNGRVLVCGGLDSAGIVTATTEIFDPVANTIVPGLPMGHARAGHAATLLANGKVLCSGGLADYQNPQQNLAAVLNTAQDTAELFDPVTNAWSPVPGTMASKRSGHVHTVLPSGRVLLSGGIQGGLTTPFGFDLPTYTATCNVYDPIANSLLATGSMQVARAFHGGSVLASGDVLVTGGVTTNALFAIVGATDSCERWNGSVFAASGLLPTPASNHVQFAAADGRAVIVGGLTGIFPVLGGTATAGRHDGTTFAAGRNVGENAGNPLAVALPRGAMTGTRLSCGSWLLLGGTDGAVPLADALVFLP